MTSVVVANLISWSYETLKVFSKGMSHRVSPFPSPFVSSVSRSSDFLSGQDVCSDIYK